MKSNNTRPSLLRRPRVVLLVWALLMPSLIQSLVCLDGFSNSSIADDRPNVIIMMADDMGFSDIGCYGGEIRTPALDNLATNGIRFTQFYNTGRCCPTRAALLSGLYSHQAGVGWMMSDNGYDGYRGELNRNCMTIAEVLKTAGYSTYMSGKWHVTKDVRPDGDKANWPRQRGFDKFFGTIHGAGSFYDPNSLTLDNKQITPQQFNDKKDFYYTDAISDYAVQCIDEHKSENPFFMYVAYTAPHWPMHALPEDIERYKGRYDDGWDALRGQRYARQKKMGLIDESWSLTPRDTGVPVWPAEKEKAWQIRRMEVYAAMVDRMDFGIGRIVNKLKESNQLENTLILFLADNGGCAEEYGSSGPPRPTLADGRKIPLMKEGELQTRMQPLITRDGTPVKTGKGVMPGPADTYVAYGKGWANASNTPFRLYKHWVHEGGISSPLIAHWPKQIQRKGEFERQPGHLIDLMATCVDVSKAEYPATYKGKDIKPLEGKSLVPAFAGQDLKRDAIYWEHEGNRAIRQGDWKLVAKGVNGPWELYNIAEDRTELNDLASKNPQKAGELAKKWDAWAKRANVYPLTPYYNNRKGLSKKKKFKLKPGDNLPKNNAPNVSNRTFTITGDISAKAKNGVIIAQGGTAHGYAWYLKENKLQFAVRLNGELTVLSASAEFPEKAKIEFRYQKSGQVTAKINGVEQIKGKVKSGLVAMPADGLQVGADDNGNVGDYSSPHKLDLTGKLNLQIQ